MGAFNGTRNGVGKLHREARAASDAAKVYEAPTPPPPPDSTDELVRKARQAARNQQLMARGRKSTFSVPFGS